MTNAAIELIDINKSFNKKQIISDFSIQIKSDRIVGLIGPNGAGKSTLIKITVGLIKADRGEVYINGISLIKNFEKAVAHVGCIVEIPEFFANMSAYNNLKYLAGFRKNITADRINHLIKKVGLTNRSNDKVRKYSLGMKQRLGLAQALLGKPKILIVDEPFNSLDPNSMYKLRNLLKEMATNEGITILISSHNLNEIENLCDEIIFIREGKALFHKDINMILNTYDYLITVPPQYIDKAFLLLANYAPIKKENGIHISRADKCRNDILIKLINNDIPIGEIKNIKKNLEDIYLSQTKGAYDVK